MAKKKIPIYSSLTPLKKITFGGIGSFLLVLILPKSFSFFIRHWFAGIAKNTLIIVLAGLLSQKALNKFLEHDPTSSKRPPE